MLFLLTMACTDAPEVAEPALAFLTPAEGDVLAAGDIDVDLLVEGFALTSPAKHGGEAIGVVAIRVDGHEVIELAGTRCTLLLEPGAHTLAAELLYEDGDPLEPPVMAEVGVGVVAE